MSKRGKRRNSKRRKSSSSSKQSVTQYIFQKQNKSNSIGYKDEILEKGETDSFRKENALSESEDEEKYNGTPPKEKRFKQDYPVNLFPNQRNIYTTTTKDTEKGVKIVTSVSVDDVDDTAPKFMFQQLQEPLYSNPTNPSQTPVANIMKINCSGSQVKLEIQEIRQLDSSGLKTTFVLFNEKGVGASTVFKSKCERTWIPNNDQPFQHVSTENYRFTFSSTSEQMESQTDSHSVSPNTMWDKDQNPVFTVPGHSPDPQVNLTPHVERKYFHKSFSSDQCWDIPPPRQFADFKFNTLEDLSGDLASCRINDCSPVEQPKLPQTPNIVYNDDHRCPFNLEVTERRHLTPSFDQLSESDNYEPIFMRPSVSTNRSSFTKAFINCQKRKSWIRNNSIATVERKACYLPRKRRQTFPGPSGSLLQEDFLLPYSESFSSLTMCSHSLQTDKRHHSDDRCPLMGKYNSSQGKGDKEDHVFTINRHYRRQSSIRYHYKDSRRQDLERFVSKDRESLDTDDCEDKDQAEVADSGFDQDIGEVDCHGSEILINELSPRTLAIKVIPPSCCGSEEQMLQSHPVSYPSSKIKDESQEKSILVHQASSTTSDGELEQRILQVDTRSSLGICSENTPSVDPDPGGIRLEDPDVHSSSAEESCLKLVPGKSADSVTFSSQMSDDTNPKLSDSEDSHKTIVTTCSDTKLCKHDKVDRQSTSRSFFEGKELLKPVVHKDSDNGGPDHWAKRRKLFRESKQWSSAGECSITSDITEESVSEDAPAIDMNVQDSEDRGFYTETFHSAAWIYQGDNVTSESIPPSLNSRNRAISIRERTVKISKGTGEYPWGFRIQFSKPIVVTEVDTNGAAEEAGLLVGDYVLAVNGTDVTSIPHSEAADLARQGPDILTLTIGSDIARGPNTPRPGCRGYLHKRTQSGLIKGWRKRWFVLMHDCCLYYYRHKRDEGKRQPLSAIKLEGAEVGPDVSLGKPFVIKCRPLLANRVYFLCATTNQEMKRWLGAMEKAIHPITQNHVWLDVTRHNSNLPPLAVKNPECLGLLHKIDKIKDMWIQHYCILKDSCLYLYSGIRATHAHGGIYLHGYMVREQPYGSKKSTIELKPPSDEFKTFYFCAENPNENKRWIIALNASIKKWLPLHRALQDYMSRPSEETRM